VTAGHGFPIGNPLHRHGPWITDGAFAAHANLPFFQTLHDWLPRKDGVYRITGGLGGTYTYAKGSGAGKRMLEGLHAAPRWPARIIERAPHNPTDIDDPGDVMGNREPWYVENPTDRARIITFDGRIAATVEIAVPGRDVIDHWEMLHYARDEWALVGTVHDQTRFYLAQVLA
jgi:hypothetical protein